jgi:NAD(P)-dependent dehydrogenase (short-subunit alcohol dehydrogenase family)
MTTHTGRIAVVTGAGRGVGQAIAVGIAQRSAAVVGVDIADLQETQCLVEGHGAEWLGVTADVSSPDAVARMAEAIFNRFPRCDILVNNAGIFPTRSFDDLSFEEWRRVIGVNVDSQFLVSKALVPSMKQGGWGRIVNLTSGSVQLATENTTAYKTSKMAVIGLTRAMSADLGKFGITVNAASPSLTRTPGILETPAAAAKLAVVSQMQAIKRVSEPDDIVGLVLFLTGDDSHFVTGQTILADGGLSYF